MRENDRKAWEERENMQTKKIKFRPIQNAENSLYSFTKPLFIYLFLIIFISISQVDSGINNCSFSVGDFVKHLRHGKYD